MKNRVLIVAAVLLALSIGNYMRIISSVPVRPVQFLSIFLMGLFTGVLFIELIRSRKKR